MERLMSEGGHNQNRKSTTKRAIELLIRIRIALYWFLIKLQKS